jgi:hypothetical protein
MEGLGRALAPGENRGKWRRDERQRFEGQVVEKVVIHGPIVARRDDAAMTGPG